jgi:hypothetical protein
VYAWPRVNYISRRISKKKAGHCAGPAFPVWRFSGVRLWLAALLAMVLLVVLCVRAVAVRFAATRCGPMIRSVLHRRAIYMWIAALHLGRCVVHMWIATRHSLGPVTARVLRRPLFASIVYMRVVGPA